jgi:hypothetical protein
MNQVLICEQLGISKEGTVDVANLQLSRRPKPP